MSTLLNSTMQNTAGNPFDHAFEMLGQEPHVATDSINAEALELMTQVMASSSSKRGRMILLRAPRAGYGKTHLLTRVHQRLAHTHEFISLEPTKGKILDAANVLDAVLRRFSRVLPAGDGLTLLDLLARRIFAIGLEPLVRSGEVGCQDRDVTIKSLQLRPVEAFDFHNEEAVTAHWAMANFRQLGPRLSTELSEQIGVGFRPVVWWIELLFRYSSAPLEQTTRNSSLFETVYNAGSIESDVHEKLVALLNLVGLVMPPVLILDEVEGFSSDPDAALQVATFLNSLHQSCENLAVIISVNGDVWETAFLPHMPCGLKDRLNDIVIDLRPMTKKQAIDLVKDRAGDRAEDILPRMNFDAEGIYARGLIREASKLWSDIELQGQNLDPISLSISDEITAEPEKSLEKEVAPEPEVAPPPVEPESFVELVTPPVEEEILPEQPISVKADSSVIAPSAEEGEFMGVLNNPHSAGSPQLSSRSVTKHSYSDGLGYYGDVEDEPQNDRVSVSEEERVDDTEEPVILKAESDEAIQNPVTLLTPGIAPTLSPSPITPPEAPESAAVPHKVTSEDQEKVDDLLRQFRDRFGRD